jgi:hypothetical protein
LLLHGTATELYRHYTAADSPWPLLQMLSPRALVMGSSSGAKAQQQRSGSPQELRHSSPKLSQPAGSSGRPSAGANAQDLAAAASLPEATLGLAPAASASAAMTSSLPSIAQYCSPGMSTTSPQQQPWPQHQAASKPPLMYAELTDQGIFVKEGTPVPYERTAQPSPREQRAYEAETRYLAARQARQDGQRGYTGFTAAAPPSVSSVGSAASPATPGSGLRELLPEEMAVGQGSYGPGGSGRMQAVPGAGMAAAGAQQLGSPRWTQQESSGASADITLKATAMMFMGSRRQ